MLRFWTSLALLCATPLAHGAVDEVVQWNKTLLTIVRTAGAQPATVHPTRSFAIIKKNPGNTVSTQVALKRALPNVTYEVGLVQTPIFNA